MSTPKVVSWADMCDDDDIISVGNNVGDIDNNIQFMDAVIKCDDDDGFVSVKPKKTVIKKNKTVVTPEYTDRIINCRTCSAKFKFSAVKQIEFSSRSWADPKNCPGCSSKKR
jgi:hypothetical protein